MIDEIQMIADLDRGGAWTKALLGNTMFNGTMKPSNNGHTCFGLLRGCPLFEVILCGPLWRGLSFIGWFHCVLVAMISSLC